VGSQQRVTGWMLGTGPSSCGATICPPTEEITSGTDGVPTRVPDEDTSGLVAFRTNEG
jgi:hypothetical protein